MSEKNYLRDETVILKYLPDLKNGITDKRHQLYGGFSSNASIAVPAPLLTRQIDKIFTKDELAFLSKELKQDLNPNSDFWKEYKKDDFGMPIGIFPIYLRKEGMLLNKKDPIDYIKIRVLENFPIVAKNQAEIKNRSSQYRFVLIKKDEEHKQDINNMSYEKQATKLHSKYENNKEVLAYILKSFNRNVSYSSSLDFLVNETWKLVKSVPKLFVATVEDELLETKILLDSFVRYKLVNKSNKLYYTSTGDPLRLDGELNDYDGAARFLDSGAGQEMLLELQAKVKVLKKK